jgi:hypothetical protein
MEDCVMRQTIIGGLVVVFGPIATHFLERFMTNAPEWILGLAKFGCVVAGLVIAGLSDQVYFYLRDSREHPISASIIIGFSFFIAASAGWYFLYIPSFQKTKQDQTVFEGLPFPTRSVPPAPQVRAEAESPTLRTKYDMKDFPIMLSPNSTTYLLQLHPAIERWIFELGNGPKETQWPREGSDVERLMEGGPESRLIEAFFVCELTNHGSKALLDLLLIFEEFFYDPINVPVTKMTNPDGTYTLTVPTPQPGEGAVFTAREWTDKPIGFRPGNLVKSFKHKITIPVIEPNGTFKLYIINQSRYIAKFIFPLEADSLIAGSPQKVKIDLIRPEVNIKDEMKAGYLPPTQYKWPGIPDS